MALISTVLVVAQALAAGGGDAILGRVAKMDAGYVDQSSSSQMRIHVEGKPLLVRDLLVSDVETAKGGHRTKLVFQTPKDVAGTILLTHLLPESEDQQWVFLPAFGKARKIAPSTQTASFLGSDFTYEDLKLITVIPSRFSCDDLGFEHRDGAGFSKLECRPRYQNSGYKAIRGWIDTASWTIRRMEFLDRSGKVVKQMTSAGWSKVEGHWRPGTVRIETLATRGWTELVWSGYRFGRGLKPRDFDAGSLK